MKRGEVWWAELPPPVASRPVVILTRGSVLHSIDAIVVALVTRTVRQLPTEVVLGRRQGLPDTLAGYAPNNYTFTSAEFGVSNTKPSAGESSMKARKSGANPAPRTLSLAAI